MAFPTYTAVDVSNATGRPIEAYPAWTAQALQQAMLLFKLSTCLKVWPTDPDKAQLAEYAVLFMADHNVIIQPYQTTIQGPFQSEGIGSYNYSLRQAMINIQAGKPTGVMWFDEAVNRLGECGIDGDGGVTGGGIGVFENDVRFWEDSDGKKHVLSPKDYNPVDFPLGFGSLTGVDPR